MLIFLYPGDLLALETLLLLSESVPSVQKIGLWCAIILLSAMNMFPPFS